MNEINREDLFVDWRYNYEERLIREFAKDKDTEFYDWCVNKFKDEHPPEKDSDELTTIVEDNL